MADHRDLGPEPGEREGERERERERERESRISSIAAAGIIIVRIAGYGTEGKAYFLAPVSARPP